MHKWNLFDRSQLGTQSIFDNFDSFGDHIYNYTNLYFINYAKYELNYFKSKIIVYRIWIMLPKLGQQKMKVNAQNKSNQKEYSSQNLKKSNMINKGVSFGKAQRNINPILNQNLPGPANYSTISLRNDKAVSFTKGLRQNNSYKYAYPGPGSYHMQDKQKQKVDKFTMPGRYVCQQKQFVSPGPANYQVIIQKKIQKQKFGKSSRFIKARQMSPGPGDYNLPVQNFILKKSRSVKSITQTVKPIQNITPGPGQYLSNNQSSKIKQRRGISFASKYKDIDSNTTNQAFNKYFPKGFPTQIIKKKSQAYSIGKSQKLKLQASVSPGPTQYQINYISKNPQATIPKSKYVRQVNQTPGPGQYHINDKNKHSIAFTIKRSGSESFFNSNKKHQSPGVGAYKIQNSNKDNNKGGKSSLLTQSNRHDITIMNKVGVGEYNIR